MKWLRVLWLLPLMQSVVMASSPNWQDNTKWENWPTVGKADLSWLFFNIYKSELKSPTGHYLESNDVTPHPIALSIIYQQDITKEQLINATQEQWINLGYSQELQGQWLLELDSIYKNVKKGERLVYVTDGTAGEFRFFGENSKEIKLGEIDSEQLNDAFLSIWLSPSTEYPKHRAGLIGMK